MSDLIPQGQPPDEPAADRPLKKTEKPLANIADSKREAKRLKAQATIPLLKAAKDEVVRRVKSGEIWDELKKLSFSSLVRNLSVLESILREDVALVNLNMNPAPAAPSDGKDQTFFKAKSAIRLSEKERKQRIIDAEVEKPK